MKKENLMKYSKEIIEERLKDILYECLSNANQESGLISLEYDEENEECNVKLSVCIVEEDDYVGFDGY